MQVSTNELLRKFSCSWDDKTFVNYCDFPCKAPRICNKSFVPKIAQHGRWEMSIKMSRRVSRVFFAIFFEMTQLACPLYASCFLPIFPLRFVLPQSICFLRVCFRTLLAAVFKFFLLLSTSAIFSGAFFNKSTHSRFAARRTFSNKDGIFVHPITAVSGLSLNSLPGCRPIPP